MTKLIQQLTLHEGLRFRPYKCTAGKLTIGIGRNLDDKPILASEQQKLFGKVLTQQQLTETLNRGITKEQAELILSWDVLDAVADAKALLPNFAKLSEQRQFVIIDMAFNMGRRGLGTFRNTLRMINEGDYTQAAANMLKSKWAKQVKSRAIRLSIMMRDNLYHDQVTTQMLRNLG
jgi:lysozyme